MRLINTNKRSGYRKTQVLLLCPRVLIFVLLWGMVTAASVHDNEILYIGGNGGSVPNGTKGRFSLLSKDAARFDSVQGSFEIPYKGVKRLGYGEKVSRRILEGLTINIALIFSKRHQHFFTVQYLDQDRAPKVAVFEIGKDNIHPVVTVFENRALLKCEFESTQAEADFRKTDFQPKTTAHEGEKQ
jgi:hypothetical protein